MKDSLVEQAQAVKIETLTDRDKAAAARAILIVRKDISWALELASAEARFRSGSFLRGFTAACEVIADVFEDWQESSPVDPALTAAGALYDTVTEAA